MLEQPLEPNSHDLEERMNSSRIASALRRSILDGEYIYNDRLPAERRLASMFGAARGTVREALRQLEQMNLVTRKIGSGTYVRHREREQHEEIAEHTSPIKLIEVRLAMEPDMARLAVTNANSRNIRKLNHALSKAEAAINSPNIFSEADEEFHLALAECSQNPLMVWLYSHVNEVRSHNQWNARKDKILSPEKIRSYNQQHRELFEAVNSRDAERASDVLTLHLNEARSDLIGIDGVN